MTRILDGSVSPIAFFGAELRRVREDAGMSQEQLGRAISFSGDLVGKIETCDRSPTRDFAKRVDTVFPHLKGHFLRLFELARRWEGPLPQWFQDWLVAEREALSLRSWEPLVMPGLLQTPDYARTIFGADPELDEDDLDGRVAARMERQLILTRPRPPELSVLLDESVLHRCIGSAKIMHDQLVHVAEMSRRPRISVQIVPAGVGTHAGLLGAFAIADFDGKPSILYVETAVEGFTIERPARVRKAALRFDRLRAEALPRGASRDLIMKVAEERWTT